MCHSDVMYHFNLLSFALVIYKKSIIWAPK